MALDLTTCFLFKQFAGKNDLAAGEEPKIAAIVTSVSERIGEECDRTFEQTIYKKWLDGSGTNRQLLPDWPIRTLTRVSTQICDSLELQFTGGTQADVTFDGVTLTLHTINNAGAENTDTVLVSASATVTAMSTAVNALSGWTASIRGTQDNEPSQLLRPIQARDALFPDCAILESPFDQRQVRISSEAERMIESDAVGGVPTGLIRDSDSFNPWQIAPGPRTFGGNISGTFPRGWSNIFVWWTAGYTLPVDEDGGGSLKTPGNVPQGLTLIANQITKDVYDYTSQDASLVSEKLADSTTTVSQALAGGSITMSNFIDRRLGDLVPWMKKDLGM